MKPSKVKRSYDRFNDYSADLINSDYNTFNDRANMLIDFCETDEVLKLVHEQLINHKNVDFDTWYQERKATIGGMVGSGELTFPTKIDDRMAIQYQLIYKIKEIGRAHV